MLGDSSLLGGSGGEVAGEYEAVGSILNKSGDRSFVGGNRWPRQETLALLKIRSDMDVVFREATDKGPLWDDVSRKLAEVGYDRSAKKCKEKLENIYKYHKRTKDGRGSKADNKTYRFFDQLEALHPNTQTNIPQLNHHSDSSTSTYSGKNKRKWKEFFHRLTKEVINKQEELQNKLLDAIEKREQQRIARENSWRMQEMARRSREREIIAQERAVAAAKDSSVMSFLQKVSQHKNTTPPPKPSTETTPTSSRWPKTEVEALIRLRTEAESSGAKGTLWEEIAGGMRGMGYNRNSKRCKEKWENINKYFKKVKESNKERPQHSKTCPYFYQLEALYTNRHITQSALPLQQWPPLSEEPNHNNMKVNDSDHDGDGEHEEGEDEFEVVATKPLGCDHFFDNTVNLGECEF